VVVKAREPGWEPTPVLASAGAAAPEVLEPSGLADTTGPQEVYTISSMKDLDDPRRASDPEVGGYVALMEQECPELDPRMSNAVWGYATMATAVRALEETDEVSREGLHAAVEELDGSAPSCTRTSSSTAPSTTRRR
jgi:hypothetical protein